ncbi:MAG: hypothetical protein HRU19_30825 [Pseudobacteriovorax sp.]|nr:hypothetical protein [Pseudobacteriovorax sp.]
MKNQKWCFGYDYEIDVAFFDPRIQKDECGVLRMYRNKGAELRIKSFDNFVYSHASQHIQKIVCRSESREFVLISCDTMNQQIFAEYVIIGETRYNSISKCYFVISGLANWVNNRFDFQENCDMFVKKLPKERLKAEFSFGDKKYLVESKYCSNASSDDKGNLNFTDWLELKISSTPETNIEISEVAILCENFVNFFSLLLLTPLAIKSVEISDDDKLSSLFFYSKSNREDSGESRIKYFSKIEYFKEHSRFEESINKYFKLANNKNSSNAANIIPFRLESDSPFYKEFTDWVSYLDSVCDVNAVSYRKKIRDSELKKIRYILYAALDGSPELEKVPNVVRDSLNSQIAHLKGCDLVTFADKFSVLVEGLPSQVAKIINLTKTQFLFLKKFRDHVAHGKNPPLKNPGNILFEELLLNKIKVLVVFLAYKEIGVPFEIFCKFLKSTFTGRSFIDVRGLNQMELGKVVGDPVFETDKKSLEENTLLNRGAVFEFDRQNGIYSLNRDQSKKLRTYLHDNFLHHNLYDSFIEKNLEDTVAKFVSEAYFYCEEEYRIVRSLIVYESSLNE